MGHFQNNGAAGGLSLRHRDYRCTGFPFLIAGDVDCFRLAVSAPFQLLAPGIVNVPGSMPLLSSAAITLLWRFNAAPLYCSDRTM